MQLTPEELARKADLKSCIITRFMEKLPQALENNKFFVGITQHVLSDDTDARKQLRDYNILLKKEAYISPYLENCNCPVCQDRD